MVEIVETYRALGKSMTHSEMTYWAIGLKVGLTLVAALVLAVVLAVRWKRYRRQQDALDDAILRKRDHR